MPVMSWPLAVLAFLAFIGGWVNASLAGIHGFKHFLEPVTGHAQEVAVTLKHFAHSHSAEWAAAAASVIAGLIGLFLAWQMYIKNPDMPVNMARSLRGLYRMLFNKYWVDEIYETLVINPVHRFSIFMWKIIDVIIIDGIGVNGPARFMKGLGGIGRALQSGNVQTYAFWLFTGVAGVLIYLIYVAEVI
jgi:NADH-quinone oxidoreductase subunit L